MWYLRIYDYAIIDHINKFKTTFRAFDHRKGYRLSYRVRKRSFRFGILYCYTVPIYYCMFACARRGITFKHPGNNVTKKYKNIHQYSTPMDQQNYKNQTETLN